MHDTELLTLWAGAQGRFGLDRTEALARHLTGVGDVAEFPLGDLNRTLLGALQTEFGGRMECVLSCPRCGEALEAETTAAEILGPVAAVEAVHLVWEGHAVPLRLPTLADLRAARDAGTPEAAVRILHGRCGGNDATDAGTVPVAIDAVARRLEEVDPHLAVRVATRCPACGHGFDAPLDVADFLWAEVDRRARSVVAQVALLARAYGWTEDDVLSLPASRRRLYAEMVDA